MSRPQASCRVLGLTPAPHAVPRDAVPWLPIEVRPIFVRLVEMRDQPGHEVFRPVLSNGNTIVVCRMWPPKIVEQRPALLIESVANIREVSDL